MRYTSDETLLDDVRLVLSGVDIDPATPIAITYINSELLTTSDTWKSPIRVVGFWPSGLFVDAVKYALAWWHIIHNCMPNIMISENEHKMVIRFYHPNSWEGEMFIHAAGYIRNTEDVAHLNEDYEPPTVVGEGTPFGVAALDGDSIKYLATMDIPLIKRNIPLEEY